MSRPLPIIAVQAAPVAWDVRATWDRFETEVRSLRREFPRTRLFLYPELHLSAFGSALRPPPRGWSMRRVAEPIPGPLTDRLCALAKDLDVWLVPGSFYERAEDGGVYNTAIAVAPDGSIRARYQKVFPWRPYERTKAGREFVAFDIDGIGRAGLLICYDGWFPEAARQVAWLGAEVILQPTATQTSDRPQELVLARANAIVNQVYLVNVNTGAPSGVGQSVIVDPEGHALQTAGEGESFMNEVLDLDAVSRVREMGSVGMSRMWDQLAREGAGIELPLYGGSLAAARRLRSGG